MFWKKDSNGEKELSIKDIPEAVGRYLVVSLGQNPDWVWNLKAALRKNEKEKDVFEVRVFDQARVRDSKISIKNFSSLDEHPEMILYEGSFNKKTFEVNIKGRDTATPSLPKEKRPAA